MASEQAAEKQRKIEAAEQKRRQERLKGPKRVWAMGLCGKCGRSKLQSGSGVLKRCGRMGEAGGSEHESSHDPTKTAQWGGIKVMVSLLLM